MFLESIYCIVRLPIYLKSSFHIIIMITIMIITIIKLLNHVYRIFVQVTHFTSSVVKQKYPHIRPHIFLKWIPNIKYFLCPNFRNMKTFHITKAILQIFEIQTCVKRVLALQFILDYFIPYCSNII